MELGIDGFRKAGTFHIRSTLTLIETLSLRGNISAISSKLFLDESFSCSLNTIIGIWEFDQ
jgi:hypothetical protein